MQGQRERTKAHILLDEKSTQSEKIGGRYGTASDLID
jgi:hypothetical protein